MNKRLHHFFTTDHRRLDDLLDKVTKEPDHIRMEFYHPFRTGLLTHIKMEEKILFPAAQEANGGVPLTIQGKLRLDHGALTALMVMPPTPAVIKVLIQVLEQHDRMEEEPGGMYDACEALAQSRTEQILEALRQTTEVPVHPPNPSSKAVGAAQRALERAGHGELAQMLEDGAEPSVDL